MSAYSDYITGINNRIKAIFDPFNLEHRSLYPNYFSFYESRINDVVTNELHNLIGMYGPLPAKVATVKGSKFREPLFDWLFTDYNDTNAQAEEDLVFCLMDETANEHPIGIAKEERDALAEKFIKNDFSLVDRLGGNRSLEEKAISIIYEWTDLYLEYVRAIKMFEASEPAHELRRLASLKQTDFAYLFERSKRNLPLLVIPDKQLAMTIKLQFG